MVPDFLAIGHAAKDLDGDGGFTIGGTVTYAAATARRLGLRAAVVTSAAERPRSGGGAAGRRAAGEAGRGDDHVPQ